jgi:hypothetical protein
MTDEDRVLETLSDIRVLQQQVSERLDELVDRVERLSLPSGAGPGSEEQNSLVVFVHIPKTAGGTVRAMISATPSGPKTIDSGNFFKGTDHALEKISRKMRTVGRANAEAVVIGHVPYGVYRAHLPPEARYVTFLREPVDRVVSHFYRHVMNWDGRAKARFGGVESLERALTDTHLPEISNLQPALNNLQTRCLCSDPRPMGRLSESALDEAKDNLRKFAFVGIQERFTESLVLFQQTLGLTLTPTPDRHVNRYRPSVDDVDPEECRLIEEHNRLDAELYRYARTLFEERLAEVGADFPAEVEACRAATAAVKEGDQADFEAAARWLDREMPADAKTLDRGLRESAEKAGISGRQLKRARRFVKIQREEARAPQT